MKDYYQILGVSRYASLPEIKRSFRRLANLYHPDRNPSPEAEAIIKDVIEAYQILEDPVLRAQYDALTRKDEPVIASNGKSHRDPRYRRQPPNRNYKSEKQRTAEMMTLYMPYAVYMSWTTLLFCVLLVLDFSIPSQHHVELIKSVQTSSSRYAATERLYTREGHNFKIGLKSLTKFKDGNFITVSSSAWLNIPRSLTNNQTHEEVRVPATIYGNFIFAPILLLITSSLGVFYKKVITLRFNLGIVNGLLLFLNIIFLLIHLVRSI